VIAVLVACLLAGVLVIAWPGAGVLTRLAGRPERVAFDWGRLRGLLGGSPGPRTVYGAAAMSAAMGLSLGGPVAALAGAVYAWLGVGEWARRSARKRAAARRSAALDGVGAMVADLRAGLPPATVAAAHSLGQDVRISRLAGTVWRLAEQTGAPAADLLERIEVDARGAGRAAASAAAEAAGAQMTGFLLLALPLGGIGLGFAIGADPLQVLLRTPVGAACAVAALLLQCGGFEWTKRLVDGPR
jgi:tight adherence protein B